MSVLGDPRRPQYLAVERWIDGVDEDDLFVSTITVGELASGIAGLPASAKRRRFQRYLDDVVLTSFTVLTFDIDCALRWGTIMGDGRRSGRTPPVDDAKIAAVAVVHALTVVTLNPRDFRHLKVPYLDPTLS